MKKILLILIILFTLTGCYDYKEINDIAFIAGIGIDYLDDEYEITYEILNGTKKTAGDNEIKTFLLSSKGKNIATAFDNISLKISKIPYYNHLKVLVINKEVAASHLAELEDFILRNPKIRNEFYLVLCDNAKEIFKNKSEESSSASSEIEDLISSNKYDYNISYNKPFEDFLEKKLSTKITPIITEIGINNHKISALGIALFNNEKYIASLTKRESAFLNILLKNPNSITLKYNDVIIKAYYSKIKKNKNTLYYDIEAEIKSSLDYNFRNPQVYEKLNNKFSRILESDLNDLLIKLNKYDVNPLGIKNKNIKIKTNVKINKKGLIFEVQNEK